MERRAGPQDTPETARLTLGADKQPAAFDMVVLDEDGRAKATEFGLYELRGTR